MTYRNMFLGGVMLGSVLLVFPVFAQQNSLSVTVTPPLIQLAIGPGEEWRSSLKIVNNNTYEVTYYASPVDFEAEGEEGQGKFIPLVAHEGEGTTLGEWITITDEPIVVPRGGSIEVPYSVSIPENAIPGGHYAAILVGTRPQVEDVQGPTVKVSSFVSSLLFVRIKGDVIEKGRIREFSSAEQHYQTPEAEFLLRFENTGNTHLRPQGDIVITNMWGKERGRVALNAKSSFGNVLPKSTRSFTFSWKGEASIFDSGRYRAIATLAYGDNEKQTAVATTYFWVIPVVPVVGGLSAFLFFILTITWLIRRYIHKALAIERTRLRIADTESPPFPLRTLMEPIKQGVVDLRSVTRAESQVSESVAQNLDDEYHYLSHTPQPITLFGFLQKYALFFFFVMISIVGIISLWLYFSSALTPERSYEISEVTSETSESSINE